MAVERVPDNLPERLPPHNSAAEEAVLGSILIDSESLTNLAGFLRAEDFYRERNAVIYAAMLSLHDRREPVDYLTLADELQRQDKYEEPAGFPTYRRCSQSYRPRRSPNTMATSSSAPRSCAA